MHLTNFLIKPVSSTCNLRCRYCFYEDEVNNRSVKNSGLMQRETVEVLLHEACGLTKPGDTVNFIFQGGEPTVAGLTFFQDFVGLARSICPEKVGISFAIQTNGILLNKEWAQFLKQENFLVGLSIDGYKDLHNLHRIDIGKDGTWNSVRKALQLLQKENVPVNALCVVTGNCARKPEKVYNELKKLGFQYMQFIPCLDPIGVQRGSLSFSLTPQGYGEFLCRLFDLWYRDWCQGQYHSIRLFDDYVNMLLGDNTITCSTCGRCGGYFVVESDGSVYPCDFFALDEWKLGTLSRQPLAHMTSCELAAKFLHWGQNKPAECLTCQWRRLCNGGCKNDWIQDAEGTPHNYFCAAFQQFFDHALPGLMQIARAEQRARHNIFLPSQ